MKQEKKQTAVEWLISKMPIQALVLINDEVIIKAKEMEKQQIMDAWGDNVSDSDLIKRAAEKYYNEKYGK